jgi:hypothetical protein
MQRGRWLSHSGAALVNVRLDVVPLLPRSSLPTVAGCRLGGYPVGRDLWGGKRVVGGVLPRINIGVNVWGESSIMTGVYQGWCSSTLQIRWGLCDCLCLVLVLGGVGPVRGLRGGGRGGRYDEWARSGKDHPTFSYH